jgi:hypothetical protein
LLLPLNTPISDIDGMQKIFFNQQKRLFELFKNYGLKEVSTLSIKSMITNHIDPKIIDAYSKAGNPINTVVLTKEYSVFVEDVNTFDSFLLQLKLDVARRGIMLLIHSY